MKKTVVFFIFLIIASVGFAQIQTPVKWSYTAKKLNPTTYEVHLTATMDGDWHLYSQTTPDGGPVATRITFATNPLVTLQGSAKEIGRLQQRHEPLFGVDVKQFGRKVDFVQTLKLKTPVKTNVTGSIKFMVCNDEECLPPTTQKFSIVLN